MFRKTTFRGYKHQIKFCGFPVSSSQIELLKKCPVILFTGCQYFVAMWKRSRETSPCTNSIFLYGASFLCGWRRRLL